MNSFTTSVEVSTLVNVLDHQDSWGKGGHIAFLFRFGNEAKIFTGGIYSLKTIGAEEMTETNKSYG